MYPGLDFQKIIVVLGLLLSITHSVPGQIIPSDRQIEWNPGISIDQESPDGIPVYPNGVNVMDFGAKGDGITDDSKAIQSAVNACPEFHAVYFPEGDYKIANTIMVAKPIVIRGEIDGVNGLSKSLIYNDDIGFNFSGNYTLGEPVHINSGYKKDSDQLILSDASGFDPGDHVLIDQLNDGNLVTHIGIGGSSTWSSRESGTRCLGQMNRIAEIKGDTVLLETALYHSYTDSLMPQFIKIDKMLEKAGIENIHINGLYSKGSSNIRMAGVSNCWIKNAHSENADRTHFSIIRGYKCEISQNYLHHNRTGYGSMSYGVEFLLQSTANLIENNIFYHLHSAMMIAGGLTGTVFAYNYSTEIKNIQANTLGIDGGIHGGHPNMILLEGNVFYKSVCDSYWGSNAHITLFRNHIKGHAVGTTTANIAVDIQARNKFINVVGNVLGTKDFNGDYERIDENAPYWSTWAIYKIGYNSFGDGDPADNDPEVLETLIRHGNFDYVSDSINWEPGIQDREIPKSLYLQSKPAFFKNEIWPPIKPESGIETMLNDLPAKVRFDSIIAIDVESPPHPPNFGLIKVTGKTATFNWSFTEDNVGMDKYEIYRDGTKVFSTIYEGPWQDKSLKNNTDYSYTIRARDYAGNDDNASEPIKISTLDNQAYSLNVIMGSGSGSYEEGLTVPINAQDRLADGYEFSQWIGDKQYLSTSWSSTSSVEIWDNIEVGATYKKTSEKDIQAPMAPVQFSAIAVSESSIVLKWGIPDDDAGVYYFSLGYNDNTSIDSWIQELGYIDVDLTPGTLYTYRLTASDLAGNTSPAVHLSVQTLSTEDNEAPTAPFNLSATSISSSQIDLDWDASTDNDTVSGYRVFRDNINIASLSSMPTHYEDSGLIASTSYNYYLIAFDAVNNESNPSEQVTGITNPETAVEIQQSAISDEIIFFPNPSSDYLRIAHDNIKILKVYNMEGKQVLESNENLIDCTGLPRGTYILYMLTHEDKQHFNKIIVN